MGTDMQNTNTKDGTLGVQRRTTKDNQRGPPKEKGTRRADPLDEVLPGRMLATQGGKNEKSLLPQKADTWGEETERMGKGREDTPLGGGERKNPAGYRSLPKADPGAVRGKGPKQKNDYQPRNQHWKPEENDRKLGIHARKSGKRGKGPPSGNGEIQGPQKRCEASWAEVV